MRTGTIPPALLVSIHDVSPLTLPEARRAVDLALSMGVDVRALTVLAIPRHEDRAALDEDPATRDWLNRLADAGACVAIHGLSHRMRGATRHPARWVWAHGFARGQGEFYLLSEEEASERIAAARGIFRRAGLERGPTGFVPPAWLASEGARKAVRDAHFGFHELLGGIVHRGTGVHARRLIGFGSLTGIEAAATALYGRWQARREAADVRLAIHPGDMNRAVTTRAIRRALELLVNRLRPVNYDDYLATMEAAA
jgi:predicted deacetylase